MAIAKKYSPETLKKRLHAVFKDSAIQLAYLFGSHAKGKIGPLSDVDIAALWPETETSPTLASLKLQAKVQARLKDERIEIGPLNNQANSFCYQVIKDGICIFGAEQIRVSYETRIISEYLDFSYFAKQYDLIFDKAHA